MTFTEQIAGVPMELVRQGWRRQPLPEILARWSGPYRLPYRWQMGTVEATDNYIYRPIMPMRRCKTVSGLVCCVYAHAGWGEGLAPTPETARVWQWWWYRPAGDAASVAPGIVSVDLDGSLYMQGPGLYLRLVSDANGEWFGPVLPAVHGCSENVTTGDPGKLPF